MKRGIGYFVAEGAAEIIRKSRKETFLREDVSDFFGKMSQLNIPIEKIVKMYNNYKHKEDNKL
jgi:DNA-binding transcriptional regulator YhcF (GntR family)